MASLAVCDEDRGGAAPKGPDTSPADGPRPSGLTRLMIAVAASAAVLGMVKGFGGDRESSGLPHGAAASLAIAAICLLARDRRDLASALLSIACGVGVGWPLVQDACTPGGVFIGPVAGLVARAMSRTHAGMPRTTRPEASVSR